MPTASIDLVSTQAVNLFEFMNMSNPGMIKEVTRSFIESNNVYQDLPTITDGKMTTIGSRQIGLPIKVNWGATNNPNQFVNSQPTPHQEQKWLILNGIMINEFYETDKNQFPGQSPLSIQTKNLLDAISFDVNWKFFQNDPTNPGFTLNGITGNSANSFAGLGPRLANPALYQTNPECVQNANSYVSGGISLTPTAITATAMNTLIRLMQKLMYAMNSPTGKGLVAYMNEDLLPAAEEGIRLLGAGGGWRYDQDAYDRRLLHYKDMMIRDAGRVAPDTQGNQTYYNILSSETTTGAPNTAWNGAGGYTSIFIVKPGVKTFCGTQFRPMRMMKPVINPFDGVTMIANFNWQCGLWQEHTRAIGRIPGIQIN
jgi:hypothetical protein